MSLKFDSHIELSRHKKGEFSKMNGKIVRVLSIAYVFLLLGMVFNFFNFGYHVDTKYFIGIIAYYLLAFCAVAHIYISRNDAMLIIMAILLMFLAPFTLIFIPAIFLLPISRMSGFAHKTKIATGIITVLGIVFFVLFATVSIFIDESISNDTLKSPDQKKELVSIYYETATVSQVEVQFKQGFLNNSIIISRVLYSTSAGNEVIAKWLDNDTVLINGERIDVYFEEKNE